MKKIEFKKEELEHLVNTKSLKEIAEIYKCHPETVKRNIREYKIFRTTHSHLINHYFFRTWSEDMAYILGFIYADGSIIIDEKHSHYNTVIEVKKDDKQILEDIKNHIQPSINTHTYMHKNKRSNKKYDSCVVSFSSKIIVRDLINLGCVVNKTYSEKMKMPDIPNNYLGDFIRGYFDGDGTVGFYKYKTYKQKQCKIVCNNKKFLLDLQKRTQLGKVKSYQSGKGLHTWVFHGQDILGLYDLIYYKNFNIHLKRKKETFDELQIYISR